MSSETSDKPPGTEGADPGGGKPAPRAGAAWLLNLNTLVTVVTALVTAGLAVLGFVINGRLKAIETREHTEEASYKYADRFLAYIHAEHNDSPKRAQMALAALNVIAEASAGPSGESDPAWREALPVKMALLLGEPAAVATMDPQLKLAEHWMEIARNNDEDVQLTALSALAAVCRRSLRDDNARLDLNVAWRALNYADELRCTLRERQVRRSNLPGLAPDKDTTAAAVADRRLLETLTPLAALYSELSGRGWPGAGGAVNASGWFKVEIFQRLNKLVGDFLDANTYLTLNLSKAGALPDAGGPRLSPAGELAPPAADPVLARAAEVATAVQNSVDRTSRQVAAAPDEVTRHVADLVVQLADTNSDVRQRARTELALLGPAAVHPLLAEVAARRGRNAEADYKTRLGVAVALCRMRQPVLLAPPEANAAVSLLGAPDAETRRTAAEFLMNLEDQDTLQTCFRELQQLFAESLPAPQKNGSAGYNAAVVVGTWARNLPPDLPGPDPAVPLTQLALQTAREWLLELRASPRAPDWRLTTDALRDLIAHAEATQRTTVSR